MNHLLNLLLECCYICNKKISNSTNINILDGGISFNNLKELYEYYNLSDIEIKIVLFWRKVLFFLSNSDIITTITTSINNSSTSSTNSNNKRRRIDNDSDSNNANNNNVLHAIAATMSCPISIFKIAYSLYPTSIQLKDKYNRIPLHLACMSGPTTTLFTNEKQQRQWYNNNSANQYTMFQQQQRQRQHNNEIDMNIINYIALKYPNGTKLYDVYHRLPIHYALENINNNMYNNASDYNYVFYSTIICNLISYYPTCLERRDGIFKLYPFMIVATSSTSSTRDGIANNSTHQQQQQQQRYNNENNNEDDHYYDTQVTICYELLRMCPNLVSTGIY